MGEDHLRGYRGRGVHVGWIWQDDCSSGPGFGPTHDSPRSSRVAGRPATCDIDSRWLHRCVGYGQRPSRAFVCWFVNSAVVIAWSAQRRTVEDGVYGWAQRVSEVVLSPLRVLRLGSNGETGLLGGSGFEPIAYLLVGLPFIFFVLSLREFFRSPLNSRASTL